MGRSAKVHKRFKKTKSSTSISTSTSASTSAPKPVPTTVSATKPSASTPSQAQQVPSTKRRTKLKDKAGKSHKRDPESGHVLGGADYVELMLGSRRRAREEAAKLPPPS